MLAVGHAGTGTYRNALYYYCFFSSLKVLQYFDHWMVFCILLVAEVVGE